MLTLTSPVDTWLHHVPAGAKLCALAAGTFGLFALHDPFALAFALALLGAVYAALGLLHHGLRQLWPLWPFLVLLVLWHGWTGEMREGAGIVLRLLAAVMAANLVTMTTRLSAMIRVLERLAQPLRHLGVPTHRLALSIGLVIRFIPVLSDRMVQLRAAWSARSPRRAGWRIVVPATLAALDDAERVAEALRARGGAG